MLCVYTNLTSAHAHVIPDCKRSTSLHSSRYHRLKPALGTTLFITSQHSGCRSSSAANCVWVHNCNLNACIVHFPVSFFVESIIYICSRSPFHLFSPSAFPASNHVTAIDRYRDVYEVGIVALRYFHIRLDLCLLS